MNEYYKDDGTPLRCRHCLSDNLISVTKCEINGTICEFAVDCNHCGKNVGYWAYGYYDPSYLNGFPDNIVKGQPE